MRPKSTASANVPANAKANIAAAMSTYPRLPEFPPARFTDAASPSTNPSAVRGPACSRGKTLGELPLAGERFETARRSNAIYCHEEFLEKLEAAAKKAAVKQAGVAKKPKAVSRRRLPPGASERF